MKKSILFSIAVFAMVLSFNLIANHTSADQPLMQAARADCNNALRFLRRATSDKGGHRNNAMRMVNSAISEINAGINYDRHHDAVFDETFMQPAADQPNMISAKDSLKSARENLEKATEDKGGHRKNALKWVNDAIDEIQRGIEYDRNH